MDEKIKYPTLRYPLSSIIFYLLVKICNGKYWGSLRYLALDAPVVENSSEYLRRKFERLWQEEKRGTNGEEHKPSLLRIMIKGFCLEILWSGVLVFVMEVILRTFQPLLLGAVIYYFSTSGTLVTRETTIMYAAGLVASTGLSNLIQHLHFFLAYRAGMRMRVALDALIYNKVLKLNIASAEENSHGFILNLMCSDVVKFDHVLALFHYLWVGPVQTIIVSYLIWHAVGPAAIFGISSFLIIIPLQVGLQEVAAAFFKRARLKTDARISLMSEIVKGIQMIKMFTWEALFTNKADAAHSKEVKELRRLHYVKSCMRAFVYFTTSFNVFCICISYELFLKKPVSAAQVYIITSLSDILRSSMTIYFPEAISQTREATEALKRIEYLLSLEETPKQSYRNGKGKEDINAEDTVNFKNKEHTDESSKSDQISYLLSLEETPKQSYRNGKGKEDINAEDTVNFKNKEHTDESSKSDQISYLLSLEETPKQSYRNGKGKEDINAEDTVNFKNKEHTDESSKSDQISYLLSLEETPKQSYRNGKGKEDINAEDTVNFKNKEHTDESSKSDQISVSLHNVSSKWLKMQVENAINDVTLELPSGMLVAVIGFGGSGKTSLLLTLLGELHVTGGNMVLNGNISYASQQPWLFDGTIKENILFDQPYKESRYNEVIRICALRHDFQELPSGDYTLINEGGINLSGGQRARVNLARALYREADIYLLDNPLAEVDPHVSKRLFDDCIVDYLKNKTVIIVTHNTQFMSEADRVIILNNGYIADQGKFEKLQTEKYIALYEYLQWTRGMKKIRIPFESNSHYMFRKSSLEAQEFQTEKHKFFAHTTEVLTFKQIATKLYRDYFKAGGNYFALAAVLILCTASQFTATSCDFWISHWANVNEIDWKIKHNITVVKQVELSHLSRKTSILIYMYLMAASMALCFIRFFTFYNLSMKIALTLHKASVRSILHSTMEFFYVHSVGNILGTITNDFMSIHELLPPLMLNVIQSILVGVAVICVIAYTNFMLTLPTVFLLVLSILSRKRYIRISKDLRRAEGLSYTRLTEFVAATFNGLATIRAFDAQNHCTRVHNLYQNYYANVLYLRIAINEAFLFFLDSMGLSYSTFVIFSFLFIRKDYFGGDVGLIITQAVIFTAVIQWGLTQLTELENELVSIEEMSEIIATETEHPLKSPRGKKPPSTWPSAGRIRFENVYVNHYKYGPATLKNINFVVHPGEKLGIVGRSGCGKSTLIRALFRLNAVHGKILIDQRNIMEIGLHDLRKKISIIPQEPVLFTDTLRNNLDPFWEYPDSAIWDALEEVKMKETIRDFQSGLYLRLYQGGINFSLGQRQLLCLARAILHNNKILILDEAVSNVHPVAEKLLLLKLRKKFAECTILIISHRLSTVIHCDRILVLVDGKVAEFAHPYLLLSRSDGVFYKLAKEAGDNAFRFLFWNARRNYASLIAKRIAARKAREESFTSSPL